MALAIHKSTHDKSRVHEKSIKYNQALIRVTALKLYDDWLDCYMFKAITFKEFQRKGNVLRRKAYQVSWVDVLNETNRLIGKDIY